MFPTKNELLRWYRQAVAMGCAAVAFRMEDGAFVPMFINEAAYRARMFTPNHTVLPVPELLQRAVR